MPIFRSFWRNIATRDARLTPRGPRCEPGFASPPAHGVASAFARRPARGAARVAARMNPLWDDDDEGMVEASVGRLARPAATLVPPPPRPSPRPRRLDHPLAPTRQAAASRAWCRRDTLAPCARWLNAALGDAGVDCWLEAGGGDGAAATTSVADVEGLAVDLSNALHALLSDTSVAHPSLPVAARLEAAAASVRQAHQALGEERARSAALERELSSAAARWERRDADDRRRLAAASRADAGDGRKLREAEARLARTEGRNARLLHELRRAELEAERLRGRLAGALQREDREGGGPGIRGGRDRQGSAGAGGSGRGAGGWSGAAVDGDASAVAALHARRAQLLEQECAELRGLLSRAGLEPP